MDTYSTLRHFADSWALLALTGFYIAAILWAFRPGARKADEEAATIVFRHEDAPAPAGYKAGGTSDADQLSRGNA